MKSIKSHEELLKHLGQNEKSYLLLYKKGTENSDCAFQNVTKLSDQLKELQVFVADVNSVRDIHPAYSVNSAPTLIEFNQTQPVNMYKGCHDEQYFKSIFEEAYHNLKAKKEGKTPKSVKVYTTPTCSWCNTLKSYLRKNHVRFREIDVTKNESAAQDMVRKSGQQGVPQTDINGQIVVGFDKKKINQLLEIESA